MNLKGGKRQVSTEQVALDPTLATGLLDPAGHEALHDSRNGSRFEASPEVRVSTEHENAKEEGSLGELCIWGGRFYDLEVLRPRQPRGDQRLERNGAWHQYLESRGTRGGLSNHTPTRSECAITCDG